MSDILPKVLIISLIMSFILLLITVSGNYFNEQDKLIDESNIELVNSLNNQNQINENTSKSLLTRVLDFFRDSEEASLDSETSLEENLYSQQNKHWTSLKKQYETLKNAPNIFMVTIFGIPSKSVFTTFIIGCISILFLYIAYTKVRGFFGGG